MAEDLGKEQAVPVPAGVRVRAADRPGLPERGTGRGHRSVDAQLVRHLAPEHRHRAGHLGHSDADAHGLQRDRQRGHVRGAQPRLRHDRRRRRRAPHAGGRGSSGGERRHREQAQRDAPRRGHRRHRPARPDPRLQRLRQDRYRPQGRSPTAATQRRVRLHPVPVDLHRRRAGRAAGAVGVRDDRRAQGRQYTGGTTAAPAFSQDRRLRSAPPRHPAGGHRHRQRRRDGPSSTAGSRPVWPRSATTAG